MCGFCYTMEEKSSAVVSESLVNVESKTQASLVVEEAVVVVAKEPGLGGGDDGAGTVMVGSGEGSTGPMGLEVAVKKRRGRPRKYEVDGDMVGPVSLPPGISSSMSESPSKRSRGRPRGSGKLQLIASLGEFLTLQAKTFYLFFNIELAYVCAWYYVL